MWAYYSKQGCSETAILDCSVNGEKRVYSTWNNPFRVTREGVFRPKGLGSFDMQLQVCVSKAQRNLEICVGLSHDMCYRYVPIES